MRSHEMRALQVIERVDWDDTVGATYWATLGEKEMVVRVDKKKGRPRSSSRSFPGKRVSSGGEGQSLAHFSQVHSSWEDEDGQRSTSVLARR